MAQWHYAATKTLFMPDHSVINFVSLGVMAQWHFAAAETYPRMREDVIHLPCIVSIRLQNKPQHV